MAEGKVASHWTDGSNLVDLGLLGVLHGVLDGLKGLLGLRAARVFRCTDSSGFSWFCPGWSGLGSHWQGKESGPTCLLVHCKSSQLATCLFSSRFFPFKMAGRAFCSVDAGGGKEEKRPFQRL